MTDTLLERRVNSIEEAMAQLIWQHQRTEGDPSRRRKFDVLAVCGDRGFLVEVKSVARGDDSEAFIAFLKGGEFFVYFPEYRGRRLIPFFGSLYLSEDVVERLSHAGIYALSMGDEHLEVRNLERLRRQTH